MQSSSKPSRRDFLATSAVTTSALAAGLSLSRSVHAAGSDQFKIALIGSGGRGTGAAADSMRVAKHIKLVAIADAFRDKAETARKALQAFSPDQVDVPDDRLFVGLDAYKKAIACDADLIIQGTSPGFRPLHYRAAIEAGKHIFMEKPCCVDAGGFRSLMETNKLADEKGLKVGVGLFRRHMPNYLETMEKLHKEELGKIQFLRCYCNMSAWGGFPRKPGESEMEYQVRNWRVFDWLGGGRLVEAHCHELDIMDWAMQGHAVECNGMGGRTVLSNDPRYGEDYDHHFHEYTYADGTKMYSQSRTISSCWGPITEHIHTDKTVVDLVGKIPISRVRDRTQKRVNPYHQEHKDLLEAIWNDTPYNEGYFGAISSMTAILGREASYSGQVVKWDELVAKGCDYFPKEEVTWETQPPVLPDEDGRYDHAVALPGIYKPY
jgi:predicted dehydrogenase